MVTHVVDAHDHFFERRMMRSVLDPAPAGKSLLGDLRKDVDALRSHSVNGMPANTHHIRFPPTPSPSLIKKRVVQTLKAHHICRARAAGTQNDSRGYLVCLDDVLDTISMS